MRDHQRQEEEVVGNAGADAAAGGRVPPVLHVAFLELPRRRAQDLCPRLLRGAVDDGHRVLELVAEAERPARLVERRPAPHATGERLVEEPAVEHQIHRRVRRADLDRPEDAIPERSRFLQRRLHPTGLGVGADEAPGLVRGLRLPEQEDDLLLPARRHFQRGHQCGAGVDQVAGAVGEPRPAEGGRRGRGALAAEEFGAIGREGARRGIRPAAATAAKATLPAKLARPGAGGEQRAGFRVGDADHLRRGLIAEAAQHPLGVERRRQAPRPAAGVPYPKADHLDRVGRRDQDEQVLLQAVAGTREPTVALAMAHDRGRLAPARGRRRRPERSRSPRRGGTRPRRAGRSRGRCSRA